MHVTQLINLKFMHIIEKRNKSFVVVVAVDTIYKTLNAMCRRTYLVFEEIIISTPAATAAANLKKMRV